MINKIRKLKLKRRTKVLAINFGGIGDEILFLPTLKTIKTSFPNVRLTLVTEPRSKSIQSLSNHVDKIVECDIKGKAKYLEIVKMLSRVWFRGYKVAVSSGSSKLVPILLFLTGARKRYGYDSGWLSRLLLTKTVPLKKDQYAANMYHDLTRPFAGNQKIVPPEVDVKAENLVWANEKIGQRDKKIVAVHPGVSKLSVAKKMYKFWEPENWVELILNLASSGKYRVMLVGGPDDKSVFQRVRAELASHDLPENSLIDLYGETKDIGQLAALISLSDVLVCVDSAPMHVAVGVRTPVVAIFGPTDEQKLLPIEDPRFEAVRDISLECRPCLWEKRQTTCETLDCLDIPVDRVYGAIEAQLAE